MRVVPFTTEHADAWDHLVETAPMATFLHSRRFLSYHGERFQDASLLLFNSKGDLRGLLPAALDPADDRRVVSHPGVTYAGLVHDGRLNGERTRDAIAAVLSHYASRDLKSLHYKPVPYIYHRSPSADDVWALSEVGASRVGCDLSCAIDLAGRRMPSTRRARSLERARRSGIELSDDPALLAAFWALLNSTLESRHGLRPTHALEEIELLRSWFPQQIKPVCALLEDEVVAGVVVFLSHRVAHAQYLASSDLGIRTSALDIVIEHCIETARQSGLRYFDFGISPGKHRRGINPGLYRYKVEFGGGGVLYEHYEQRLELAAGQQP